MSEGLCSIFFTSREEEQKMRRIFVTDIFRARAQKRSCLMALTQLCLLACSHIIFFCPKKILISHTTTTSLFIHFQKVWQPILWRGKGLQPLPGPTLGHDPSPWLLKHAKKIIFPHHMCCFAVLLPNWNYNINNSSHTDFCSWMKKLFQFEIGQ